MTGPLRHPDPDKLDRDRSEGAPTMADTPPVAAAAPGSGAGAGGSPSAPPLFVLCPYCGHTQMSGARCDKCKGLFEPLSRQATQNSMGPWQIRSETNPFGPGLSYEKLAEIVAKGRIRRDTVVRGPTTRQFWSFACNTPGVAVLLGECHACHKSVTKDEFICPHCHAALQPSTDRQSLGLAPVKLLPGQASAPAVAASMVPGGVMRTTRTARNERPAEPRPEAPMPMPVRAPMAAAPVFLPPTPDDTVEPFARSAAPAFSVPAEQGPVPVPIIADSTARRLREQVRVLRNTVILACVAAGILPVVLLAVLMGGKVNLGTGPASNGGPVKESAAPVAPVTPTPAGNGAAPVDAGGNGGGAPAVEVRPQEAIGPHGLDAGLSEWADEIDAAEREAAKSTVESLTAAVEMLERVQDEARGVAPSKPFPKLAARIEQLRNMRDDLRLKALLG